MMTSSNGDIFRVTGHLCGEFTGHRWIPRTKASDAGLSCFLWSVWTIEWAIVRLVIWDAIAPIMTSHNYRYRSIMKTPNCSFYFIVPNGYQDSKTFLPTAHIHYSDVTWASWRLKLPLDCLFGSLFWLTTYKTSKFRITGHFMRRTHWWPEALTEGQ